jgi:type I restriction enzyme M protein
MNTMPLEATTRWLINTNLKNLGWEFEGKKQNVYLEQPRTEAERRKLGGKRPDYVLYSKESDKPLIVIEAKKKGERIDTALEQGIFYAKQLEAPLVYATDGVFCKSFHTLGNTTPKLNGEDVDEFIREALAIKFLAKWEVNTISPKVQYDRRELIKIFDEANNMLRGDGLRAGIERFGEFANILFLKLISETEDNKRLAGKQSNFVDMCHWDYIKCLKPNSRIEHINKIVYDKLNALYGTTIFTPLLIKDNDILKSIIDKLDPLTLTDVDSDVKGDAFEYFLKESTSTKNDLGEYFTPRHIVKTMVRLINPQIGEKIYDPFCGTGGFLIETFRHIERNMAGSNSQLQKILREETVYGNEITNTARITKMNMILAGDGHSNIHMQDSLANPVYLDDIIRNEKGEICRDRENNIKLSDYNYGGYDAVITNMPYSQKTNYGNLYDIPSTNGDSICVQHCMKAVSSLSKNGRIALVVPEGFLFRKDLAKMREYMLERCELQSVISLPQGVFLPYTGVKTNIIYAKKVNQKTSTKDKRRDFWYFDVKSDGYSLDNHRRKLETPSDLSKYEEYRKLDADQAEEMMQVGFEAIPLDKVRKNSFILVGSKYRQIVAKTSQYPVLPIKEICLEVIGGGTPSSNNQNYWDGNIPWITSADISDYNEIATRKYITKEGLDNSTSNIIPKGNIVVVSRVGLGKIALTPFDLAINQDLQGLIINRGKVLPEYVLLVFSTLVEELLLRSRGTTIKGITKQELLDLAIPIPPMQDQRLIVDELESYRRVVDGARSVIENYRPSIQIKDSWQIKKLSELCSINAEAIDPKKIYGENEFTYVDISSVESGTGKINLSNKVKGVVAPSRARRAFNTGDILMSTVRPNLKAFGYVDFDAQNCVASTGFAVLSPTNVNGKFLFYMLFDNYVENQLINDMGKGMYPSINKSDLDNLRIPLPPSEVQAQIVSQIETEQSLIEPNKKLVDIFSQKIQSKISGLWGE